MKTKYVVRVNVSYTKKWIVDAKSVEEAKEIYTTEGISTLLMETPKDNEIISVLTDREDAEKIWEV